MVGEVEEERQNEAGDCGTHDGRVVRRWTGEGEREVCAVYSKCFRSGTWNSHSAHAAAAIATAYDSTIMKGNINVKMEYM